MKITKPRLGNLICGEIFRNKRALRKYYLDKARAIKRITTEYWQYDFRGDLRESERMILNYDLGNKIAAISSGLRRIQRAQNTEEIISAVNIYSPLLEEVLRRTEPLIKK
ncbi:MAG: hypothetical protein WC494_01810 [Candidatus Pacearchaeota archaeon]